MVKIILYFSFFLTTAFSQKIWEIQKPDVEIISYYYEDISKATIITAIKNAVNEENPDCWPRDFLNINNNILFAVRNYPEEKEFIKEILNKLVLMDSESNIYHFDFFATEVEGYLGEESAIDKMRKFIDSGSKIIRESAIGYMALIGEYDIRYLEILFSQYERHKVSYLLSLYGVQPAFRSKVTQFLLNKINNTNDNDEIIGLLSNLLCSDQFVGVEKAKELLYSATDSIKFQIMGLINRYAFDQLPNITIEYFNNTNGQIEFFMFLPSVRGINYGWHSIKYLQPSFINCIKTNKNRLADENNRYDVNELLALFKPFKLDSTHSLQYLIDDFQNYLEEVNNYGWINESTKYAEYKTQLEYAETNIANNELEECRMKLEEFKNGIQNDFDNGLITNEAYRYLFFYPDYLIERLPDGVLSVPR